MGHVKRKTYNFQEFLENWNFGFSNNYKQDLANRGDSRLEEYLMHPIKYNQRSKLS